MCHDLVFVSILGGARPARSSPSWLHTQWWFSLVADTIIHALRFGALLLWQTLCLVQHCNMFVLSSVAHLARRNARASTRAHRGTCAGPVTWKTFDDEAMTNPCVCPLDRFWAWRELELCCWKGCFVACFRSVFSSHRSLFNPRDIYSCPALRGSAVESRAHYGTRRSQRNDRRRLHHARRSSDSVEGVVTEFCATHSVAHHT